MTEDEITLLQKRVRIAEESKARASWCIAGTTLEARGIGTCCVMR